MSRPPRPGRPPDTTGARIVGDRGEGQHGRHATYPTPPMTAAQLHHAVVDLAADAGWFVLPAEGGWLLLVRGEHLAVVAVRAEGAKLDPAEHALLAALRRQGRVTAEVWRPSDLNRVGQYLRRPRPGAGMAPW